MSKQVEHQLASSFALVIARSASDAAIPPGSGGGVRRHCHAAKRRLAMTLDPDNRQASISADWYN